MSVDTDISTFYGDEWTSTATLTHATVATSISVIFDRAGAVVQVGEMEVQTAAPAARCKTSDVSSAVRGDTMAIGGVTYYVKHKEPINNEETLVHLSTDN